MTAYTNTVLQKPFAQSTGLANLWDMFLYNGSQTYLKSQIRLFGATTGGNELEIIPSTGYDITIFPSTPEAFQLDWNGVPPAGYAFVVILRQVYGAYQEFLPGAFLSAEALNLRFNLLTLATNDLQYYQYKATPTYKPQAIYEHGKNATPPMSEGMEDYDLELPFLPGDVPTNEGDVWTWGKEIIAPGAPHGVFKPVLLHTSTSGTLPQFKADLLQECPSATSGGHFIGICAPAGSFGGQSQKLNTFIADALPHNAATTNSGAKIIGLNIDGGNQAGSTNVQDFCNQLHVESPGNPSTQSGAAGIGYDGWGLPGTTHTVASCLSRLNGPATSATDSGANHVTWWTPSSASETVQAGLSTNTQDIANLTTVVNNIQNTEYVTVPATGSGWVTLPFTAPYSIDADIFMFSLQIVGVAQTDLSPVCFINVLGALPQNLIAGSDPTPPFPDVAEWRKLVVGGQVTWQVFPSRVSTWGAFIQLKT